jgi:hypothetical protein
MLLPPVSSCNMQVEIIKPYFMAGQVLAANINNTPQICKNIFA